MDDFSKKLTPYVKQKRNIFIYLSTRSFITSSTHYLHQSTSPSNLHRHSATDSRLMEHYYKGENQEELLCKERVPIAGLPQSYGWLEVTGATRVRPVVGWEGRTVEWLGG